MGGLREALISEIERLRAGKSTPAESKAIAMLAKTALESIHTEIELRQYAKENPGDNAPLQLVSEKEVGAQPQAGNHHDSLPAPQRTIPKGNRSVYQAGVGRDFSDA